MDILTHFASHLGQKILFDNRELRLESIHQTHVVGIDKKPELIKTDDCKLIFDSDSDYYRSNAPYFISVIRSDDGYMEAVKVKPEPPEEIEKQILEAICKCSGTDEKGLKAKTRKREIVQGRQLHMALCYKLIYPNKMSLNTVGDIYNQDHATVLNALKRVKNSVEGNYDVAFRERFRSAWEVVKKKYPKNLYEPFNLTWL